VVSVVLLGHETSLILHVFGRRSLFFPFSPELDKVFRNVTLSTLPVPYRTIIPALVSNGTEIQYNFQFFTVGC
jgi:hypothetical protein